MASNVSWRAESKLPKVTAAELGRESRQLPYALAHEFAALCDCRVEW